MRKVQHVKFTLEITCNNAAFKSEDGSNDAAATEHEVARLLGNAIGQIESGEMKGTLHDYNGNTVGKWAFTGR